MPLGIQSDIPMDAVGEALLQHYNVGIQNPWYEAGYSDQQTYNRRKLPWAGKSYTVNEDGELVGDNPEISDAMANVWSQLAQQARDVLKGNEYDNLTDLYENGLAEIEVDEV